MKKLLAFFLGLSISLLYSQSDIKVPTFDGKDVVVELTVSGTPMIAISDGLVPSYTYKFPCRYSACDYPLALASVITQLRTQGYAIITSNSGSKGESNEAISYYIFRKE